MLKQKLTIEQQIEHMKNKGIKFNIVTEEQAQAFLTNSNYYFRIKAYAKNYDKYQRTDKAGQYINLEFAYLKELSILDMYLRKALFDIVADIEHFAKVRLLNDFSSNANENGYAIISSYLRENSYAMSELSQHSNLSYSHDLISKYKDNFALWNIIEVLTFNNFIKLYQLYYSKYPSKNNFSNMLWSVKTLRNAIAHNNCLLNRLNNVNALPFRKNKQINNYIAKNIRTISAMSRENKMKIPFINDFVITIHLFSNIVTSEQIRFHALDKLTDIINNRFYLNKNYFQDNQSITSTFNFLRDILDYYYENSI